MTFKVNPANPGILAGDPVRNDPPKAESAPKKLLPFDRFSRKAAPQDPVKPANPPASEKPASKPVLDLNDPASLEAILAKAKEMPVNAPEGAKIATEPQDPQGKPEAKPAKPPRSVIDEVANDILNEHLDKSQATFEQEVKEGAEARLQEKRTAADDIHTQYAGERSIYGGAYLDQSNQYVESEENRKKRSTFIFGSNKDWIQGEVQISANASYQYHKNIPSLQTVFLDEEVGLTNPGTGNPLFNAATGLYETVHRRVPGRTTLWRTDAGIQVSGHNKFNVVIPGVASIPILGTFLANALNGDMRYDFNGYYRDQQKHTAYDRYKVDRFGAVTDPVTGDIEGDVNLVATSPNRDFAWNGYVRYALPDVKVRIPFLASGYETFWSFFGIDVDPTKDHAEFGPLDLFAKIAFNPTINVAFSAERFDNVAKNVDSMLWRWEQSRSVHITHADLGYNLTISKQKGDLLLYMQENTMMRHAFAPPLLTIAEYLGLRETIAPYLEDSKRYEMHGDKPLAKTERLLWGDGVSNIVFYYQEDHAKRPQNPTLSELVPGAVGPGGPGGENVTAHGHGKGAALNLYLSKGHGWFWDNVVSGSYHIGYQTETINLRGNNVPIRTEITGAGGSGSVIANSSADLMAKLGGNWNTFGISHEVLYPLGNGLFMGVEPFFDSRHTTGEATRNTYSKKRIETFGIRGRIAAGEFHALSPTRQ